MPQDQLLQLGDFTGSGQTEMLRYIAYEGNLWIGRFSDMKLH
jgi:hypothetical protein